MCPTITKSITSELHTMTVYPLLKGTYHLEIYDSIQEASHKWSLLAPANNVFLQVPYFQFLEKNPPKGLGFRYLVFSKSTEVIGIAMCQLVQLRIGEALSDKDIPTYQQKVNAWILKLANMNAVISGNLLLTGDHGSTFHTAITPSLKYQLLKEGMDKITNHLKKQNHPVSLVIIKDIPAEKQSFLKTGIGKQYNEFALQPNMVLPMRKEWQSFEDYLAAMTSKARTRAKRAFKLGSALEKKEFTVDSLQAFLPQIDQLYKNIADKAGFNVVYLDGHYFMAFKEHFPQCFRIFGYFLEDELVAFYTTFKNHQELEAHYLGFDEGNNRKYQIYLNVLFDIIRNGINAQVTHINFARTALEIKSSVGAQPEELYFYGKHTNSLKNQIFTPVLAYFQPKVEWKPRNPFKK